MINFMKNSSKYQKRARIFQSKCKSKYCVIVTRKLIFVLKGTVVKIHF